MPRKIMFPCMRCRHCNKIITQETRPRWGKQYWKDTSAREYYVCNPETMGNYVYHEPISKEETVRNLLQAVDKL